MKNILKWTGGIIYYTTNNGNIVNVHDYWKTAEGGKYWPISNTYNKTKNLGVMKFKKPLDKIPGISGHPFLHTQTNLLTLELPTTIKKMDWGCFFGCSNLYQVNVEDLVSLEELGFGCFELTNVKKLDFRNSKLTNLGSGDDGGQAILRNINSSPAEYILFSSSIVTVGKDLVSSAPGQQTSIADTTRIKTLMIPTLNQIGNYYIENSILENLIINKFDGIADLHSFNGDTIIWVPDEWYDKYIEYYTGNTSYVNWQDIIRRLRKYSEGVPEF